MLTNISIFGFLPLDLFAGLGAAELQSALAYCNNLQNQARDLFDGFENGGPEDPARLAEKFNAIEKELKNRPPFLPHPDYFGTLKEFGNRAVNANRFAEAAEVYRRLIAKESRGHCSPSGITLYNLGRALYRAGQFMEALDTFRYSTTVNPHPRTLIGIAQCLDKTGKREEALETIRQAIAMENGKVPQTYFIQGLILGNSGDDEGAVESFREAIRLERGNFPNSHIELGISLQKLKRHDEAVGAFSSAIRLDDRLGNAYLERALTWSAMGRFEEAIRDFEKSVARGENRPFVFYSQATALRNADRVEEAISILEPLARSSHWRAHIFCELGICYRDQRRFEDSLAALNTAVEIGPTHPRNWLERATTKKLLLDGEGALSDVEKTIDLEKGKYAFSFCEKSSILVYLCRYDEALTVMMEVERRFPEHSQNWFYKGMVLDNLGRLEEALEAFVRASDLNPKEASVLYRAAIVLRKLGRYQEAWDVLTALLTIAKKRKLRDVYLEQAELLYLWERYSEASEKITLAELNGADNAQFTALKKRVAAVMQRNRGRAVAS